jgi:hypothetical protein
MYSKLVIVRADQEKPLRRMAVGARNGVILVVAEESLGRLESGETVPIGFPFSDVFEFDADVYERIRNGGIGWDAARPVKIEP